MRTVAPWTEQWQHVSHEIQEQFWGNLYQRTRGAWQRFLEAVSRRQRDEWLELAAYKRAAERRDARNGFYWGIRGAISSSRG